MLRAGFASNVAVILVGVFVAGSAQAQMKAQMTVEQAVCTATPDACGADEAGSPAKDRTDQRGLGSLFSGAGTVSASTVGKRTRNFAPAPKTTTVGLRRPRFKPLGVSRNDMMMTFANKSAELSPQARANAMIWVVALNTKLVGQRFSIEGHTNAVGTAERNHELSERRAAALVDFLVANGVDRARLDAKGFGFDRPLPKRPANAPENRRVEIQALPTAPVTASR